MMAIGAPFSVVWTQRYRPSTVISIGGLIFSVAHILASFSQHLWQFELTQGFLLGCGTCLIYMPAVTVTPTWFTARRGLAMGTILAGTGIGGVAWAPALRLLISKLGFRTALRITGSTSFILILTSASIMKWPSSQMQRINSERSATPPTLQNLFKVPLMNYHIARTRTFQAHAIGAIMQSAAYYTPVFFFASYARTLGYSASAAANFIALSNAFNAVGKVVIGYAADRLGRLNTFLLTTAVSALTALALWLPSSVSASEGDARKLFVAFAVLYGVFASAYVSLFPATLVESFGVQNFVGVNGVLYMLRGLATLVGTPVAGALIRGGGDGMKRMNKAYQNTAVMVGVLLVVATVAVMWVRVEAVVGTSANGRKWRA